MKPTDRGRPFHPTLPFSKKVSLLEEGGGGQKETRLVNTRVELATLALLAPRSNQLS